MHRTPFLSLEGFALLADDDLANAPNSFMPMANR
jgi:hypothetical protein